MNPIALYLPWLPIGGAERVFLRLAEGFLAHGVPVILLLDRHEGALLSHLPAGLTVESLHASRSLTALPRLLLWLIRRRPAILLSAISHNNILAILAQGMARGATRVVVSEHTVLSRQSALHPSWQHRLMPWLARLCYPHAAAVVAVSRAAADDLAGLLPRSAIRVIPNPVLPAGGVRPSGDSPHPWFDDGGPPVFVAAGRLVPLKGFDTLLHAVAMARRTRPLRLLLLGEGAERDALLTLVRELGLEPWVALPGAVADPCAYFARAAGVVVSSRYEGFGLVLVEAMACGAPVAATDGPGEMAEILEQGRLGPLVPVGDAEAMARAMLHLLDHPHGAEARRRRADDFSQERAVAAYLELFAQLAEAP